MNTMAELKQAKKKYASLMARMQGDMGKAEAFKADFEAFYEKCKGKSLPDMVTCASMVLKVQDYISQKHQDFVMIERQATELDAEIQKMKNQAE